jgi:hypothetical protein
VHFHLDEETRRSIERMPWWQVAAVLGGIAAIPLGAFLLRILLEQL